MKSLKSRKEKLSEASYQLEFLEREKLDASHFPVFSEQLKKHGQFPLQPTVAEILQINVGKMCNQVCAHCHVDAGPDRKEIMTQETMRDCLEALRKCESIRTVDLTGGAPEMNPHFQWFVSEITKLGRKVIVRSNLTILVSNKKFDGYPEFFRKNGVTVIASLPCYTTENTDKQRGKGVFTDSIKALQILNEKGYGKPGTGLELHLVYNPIGAHLPPSQIELEKDYKRILGEQYGIQFNQLFTITNMPISRYLEFLVASGKYEQYMDTLVNSFNLAAVPGLMCRNTISVSWDGKLHDCDFNQMLDLPVEGGMTIRNFDADTLSKRSLVVNQHCYGCTAGSGSSCQGTLV
jgi:radical SAM/Cys-rich protein